MLSIDNPQMSNIRVNTDDTLPNGYSAECDAADTLPKDTLGNNINTNINNNLMINNHLKTSGICITNRAKMSKSINKKLLNPHGWKYIKLIPNNKNPAESWGGKKNINKKFVYEDTKPKFKNWGVLTGKYNGFFILDIDSAKWNAEECKGMKEHGEHPFLTAFGEDFCERFNTYTVRTRSGGGHLYFKYDADMALLNHTCDYHQIDIRCNGGYGVGEGSYAFDKYGANGGFYTCENDVPIAECPDDLKAWICDQIRDKAYKKSGKYVKTKKEEKQAKTVKNIISKYKKNGKKYDPVDNRLWRYNVSDSEILNIVGGLGEEYFNNYSDWIKLTTFFKIIDRKHLWKQVSKAGKNYNEGMNEKAWEGVNAVDIEIVKHILIEAKAGWILPYIKYKPTLLDCEAPTHTITRTKLGINEAGTQVDFIAELGDCKYKVIKSDTGTGKTTAFKKYIKNKRKPFISIVSRRSLGLEQYATFNEFGLHTRYYEKHYFCRQGDNYITTIDSFFKYCRNIDFDDYIIFFDEWSSIQDYIIDSSTVASNRVVLTKFLVDSIRECKEAIFVDADINDGSFIALRYITPDPILYIKNTYKHNNGVKMVEFTQEDSFIKRLRGLDKYILCCDSKAVADNYFKILSDCPVLKNISTKEGDSTLFGEANAVSDIKLYTSDHDDELRMDDHKKIIFSPKVIYGLDSCMVREVFCLYKEHTINPKNMLQQIARCRNIVQLNYLFTKKRIQKPKYKTLTDCLTYLNEGDKKGVAEFGMIADEQLNEFYLHLLARIEFNNDCYNTNKFAHFLRIAEERGFKNQNLYNKTEINKALHEKTSKELKDAAEKNFNPDDEKWARLNEILKMTPEQAHTYKELYLDKAALRQHFRISKYFFIGGEKLKKKLEKHNDFNVKSIRSESSRVYFLHQYLNKVAPEHADLTKRPICAVPTTKQESKLINRGYELVFNKKLKKEIDLTNELGCDQLINKIYKQMFSSIVEKKRGFSYKGHYKDPEKLKRGYKWELIPEVIKGHKEIYDLRQEMTGPVEFLPETEHDEDTSKHAYAKDIPNAVNVAVGIAKYFVKVK